MAKKSEPKVYKPKPGDFRLRVRACSDGKTGWFNIWLLEGPLAGSQCRMWTTLLPDAAEKLAAWFESFGVPVDREEQPGECPPPETLTELSGDLFAGHAEETL